MQYSANIEYYIRVQWDSNIPYK